jgi:hypothetical protein
MMLHTFLADDVARAKVEETARRAARAAELARAEIVIRGRMRVAIGRRLVRAGLRLSGATEAAAFGPQVQTDPCL